MLKIPRPGPSASAADHQLYASLVDQDILLLIHVCRVDWQLCWEETTLLINYVFAHHITAGEYAWFTIRDIQARYTGGDLGAALRVPGWQQNLQPLVRSAVLDFELTAQQFGMGHSMTAIANASAPATYQAAILAQVSGSIPSELHGTVQQSASSVAIHAVSNVAGKCPNNWCNRHWLIAHQ